MRNRGLLIHAETREALVRVINRVAPEHLELAMSMPESLLPDIRSAGAIFVGQYSPEVVGDYTAGPSHVLPTSGTARFASALGVYDFQLRQSFDSVFKNAVGATSRVQPRFLPKKKVFMRMLCRRPSVLKATNDDRFDQSL